MRGSDLDRELASLPREHADGRPPRDAIRALVDSVREGLKGDDLVVDLLGKEVEARDGEPGLAPFAVDPASGVRLAFAYWSPGRAAGAHDHSGWTVTAVVHNRLEVATFAYEASIEARRLIPKNVFAAPAGLAGHIYEPCIHEPRNPTGSWSISLHLFGRHDQPVLLDEVGRIEGLTAMPVAAALAGPLALALSAHTRESVRRVQIEALTGRGERARSLIASIGRRGDAGTRLCAARALGSSASLRTGRPLRRRWPGVALSVDLGARAELRARGDGGGVARTLLRTDLAARGALEAIAAADEVTPARLPGLEPDAQLAIASALVHWGVFVPEDDALDLSL